MKHLKIFYILLVLVYSFHPIMAKNIQLSSNQYILFNRNDENIITSSSPSTKVDPSIFTQWLSSLLIIENTRHFDKEFSLNLLDFQTYHESELKIGEVLNVQDALFAILLNHDGSATNAAARHMAGTNQEFIRLLNKKAKSIGMTHTNFTNVTGVIDYNQYTTLEDLAILVHYALNNDIFYKIISMKEYTFTTNIQKHSLINEGYNVFEEKNIYAVSEFHSSNSLYGIVSAYKHDNKEYIFISLSNQKKDCIEDTELIYAQTASSQHFITPLKKENIVGTISLGFYLKRNIPIILEDDITILINKEIALSSLTYEFIPTINPILIYPDTSVGIVKIYQNNEIIKTSKVYSSKLYLSYEVYIFIFSFISIIFIMIYVLKKRNN